MQRVLIEASKEHLTLTLCVGDYTGFQCDTVVNYVLPGASETSFRIFHKRRDEGGDSEEKLIRNFDEELRPWTVHKIFTDRIPCSELICIVLPAWQNNYDKSLSTRINQILTEAVQMASSTSSIAFASFSTEPFSYPVDFYAHQMISFLTDASVFLHVSQREIYTVTLFTESAECKPVFEEQLHCFGFHTELVSSKQPSSIDKPRVITLEGPDYNAFINQLYDDIHAKPREGEPWEHYLSETDWILAKPLFIGYLKRVAAILSEDDVTNHLGLYTEKSISLLTNLSHANLILSTLYKSSQCCNQLSLHKDIAEDSVFVKCSVNFICTILKLSDVKVWWGVSVLLTALISWSLQSRPDLIITLENCDGLINIMKALQFVCVQDLTQENVLTQGVWLNLLILYQCAANAYVPSFYDNITGFSNMLLNLVQHAPDKEIVIISKCLLTRLLVVGNGTSDNIILKGEEVNYIIHMLQSDLPEPLTYHGLSYITLFSMILDLAAVDENRTKLLDHNILLVIAELTDKLPSLEQEAAIKVVSIFLQENYNISSITLEEPHISTAKEEGSSVHSEDSVLKNDAADYIFNVLLHFITNCLSSCNDHSLDEVGKKLVNLWPSIAVAVTLMRKILTQSDETTRDSVMQVVMSYPCIFQDLFMAYEIESSHQIMIHVFNDVVWFLAICTNHCSDLAQRCTRSSALFLPTVTLHVARILNRYDEKIIVFSLHLLLNCALNGKSYPSFYFADAINELKACVKLSDFKLAYLAKFTLSCFVQYLDSYEILDLKLTGKEASFCIDALSEATKSSDLESETFTAYEMLLVLINFTHPYFLQDKMSTKHLLATDLKKSSLFSQNMLESLHLLKENFSLLMADELFQSIAVILKPSVEKSIQEKCIQFVWNLIHHIPAKEKILSNFNEIVSAIKVCWKSPFLELQAISYCVLYLLGEINCDADASGKLRYAESCYLYENHFEAASVSYEISFNMSSTADQINQAQLLKGKSLFYMYQPKIRYLMKNRQEIQKMEIKLLETECFSAIKETIQIFGHAFDSGYLDSEGSKLFDWAMMDCIREINRLNLCKRCLMCRTSKTLYRSHIWPKFVLQQMLSAHNNLSNTQGSKKFSFGLEKHKIKSAGECWFWMLCSQCEETMSQNAESDFSVYFPKEIAAQKVKYKAWFFNYCCAILLRTLAFVKFPRCFNDEEIYYTFVYCRNHLLSLQVRVGEMECVSTKHKLWQYCTKSLDIKPYVFIMPSNLVMQDSKIVIQPGIASCNWLAPHRLLDGWRDFSGFSHFFAACCNCVCIVIKFSPSSLCYIPERYEINLTGGSYAIEDERDRINAIPNGLWMLWNRMILLDNVTLSGIMRYLSTGAAIKMLSGKEAPMSKLFDLSELTLNKQDYDDDVAVKVSYPMTSVHQMNFLPSEFMLADAGLCSTQRKIKFPEGHEVLCHENFEESKQSLLCFIGIGSSNLYPINKPYIIFVYLSLENNVEYLDGAFLSTSDKGKVQLSEYFLNHEVANVMRSNFGEHHKFVAYASTVLLMKFGVGTLPSLLHYLQCRHDIKPRGLPAYACKYSSKDCWYCRDLCHYCLKPGKLSCSLPDSTIQYCSDTCLTFLCTKPKQLSKNMLVFTHCIEGDKFSDTSVLDVLEIHRSDNPNVNQFELVHICLQQCSGNPSSYNPYIIWHKRTICYQIIPIFYISEDCKIIGSFESGDNPEFTAAVDQIIHKQEKKLEHLISTAVRHLGYNKLSDFLSYCIKCLNKSESLHQSSHSVVERPCYDQTKEKISLFVSVVSLPNPKIIIPEHFLTGMSIVNSQIIEIQVDLSDSNDLCLDIRVTSPFKDEFNLQLEAVNINSAVGHFIPSFPGEYILHFSLKLSVANFSMKVDGHNVSVTVF